MRRSDRKSIVDLLRGVPNIGSCSDKELATLAQIVDVVTVDEGKVLIQEGAHGRESFVIVDGQAEVSRKGTVLATLGEGEFVGEMAMLIDQPRSATVTAITPMRLLVTNAQTFGAFFEQAGMGRRLASGLAERLSRLQQAGDAPH